MEGVEKAVEKRCVLLGGWVNEVLKRPYPFLLSFSTPSFSTPSFPTPQPLNNTLIFQHSPIQHPLQSSSLQAYHFHLIFLIFFLIAIFAFLVKRERKGKEKENQHEHHLSAGE